MRREPDVVVIGRGRKARASLFSTQKHRQARQNAMEAMSSTHIYQDSLCVGPRPTDSLLLVPSGGGAQWLESRDFQQEHHVGIHPFSAHEETVLRSIMQEVLNSCLARGANDESVSL